MVMNLNSVQKGVKIIKHQPEIDGYEPKPPLHRPCTALAPPLHRTSTAPAPHQHRTSTSTPHQHQHTAQAPAHRASTSTSTPHRTSSLPGRRFPRKRPERAQNHDFWTSEIAPCHGVSGREKEISTKFVDFEDFERNSHKFRELRLVSAISWPEPRNHRNRRWQAQLGASCVILLKFVGGTSGNFNEIRGKASKAELFDHRNRAVPWCFASGEG